MDVNTSGDINSWVYSGRIYFGAIFNEMLGVLIKRLNRMEGSLGFPQYHTTILRNILESSSDKRRIKYKVTKTYTNLRDFYQARHNIS